MRLSAAAQLSFCQFTSVTPSSLISKPPFSVIMPRLCDPTSSKDEVTSLMDKHASENADKPLYLAFFSTVSRTYLKSNIEQRLIDLLAVGAHLP